jgi:MFS family permease
MNLANARAKNLGLLSAGSAVSFIVLMGVVSLFADMTYEGARSLKGQFLSFLEASAVAVGLAARAGEFLGYALRFISGYISDRTRRYWAITFIGYAINLFAVPVLALVGRWEWEVGLIFAERIGKAIRNPARDAMLSHAVSRVGAGWGFGLHEALDQIGAVLGPLLMVGVFLMSGNASMTFSTYQTGYAFLVIPALLALAVLTLARRRFPHPSHLERIALAPAQWIPAFYALAMAIDALAALVLGYFYDRRGFPILLGVFVTAAFAAPLVFLGNLSLALVGLALWAIGLGAQESLLKAAVTSLALSDKRGTAYGLFHTGFGLYWFLGSVLLGYLYDYSLTSLVIFSGAMQLAVAPLFILAGRGITLGE